MHNIKIPIPKSGFDLKATLESGQVFSFQKKGEGYEGSLCGSQVFVTQEDQSLDINSHSKLKKSKVEHYFDLHLDLNPLRAILQNDEHLRSTIDHFWGLRLCNQDSWEVIANFIISSNNNIKRIQKIWHDLSAYYCPDNKGSFPRPELLARTSENQLRNLGLGYRAPYLLKTAQRICSVRDWIPSVNDLSNDQARLKVQELPGVGPKVADCILLYGYHRLESFPVDVWILRMMRQLYFKNRMKTPESIIRYAQKKWGNWAGYVQQYIFYGARLGIL